MAPEGDDALGEVVRARVGVAHLRRGLRGGEDVRAAGEVGVEQRHEFRERHELPFEDEFADGGERILRTNGSPACNAKNRYSLPSEMALSWQAFMDGMKAGSKK